MISVESVNLKKKDIKNILVFSESRESIEVCLLFISSLLKKLPINSHILVADINEEFEYLINSSDVYISGEMTHSLLDEMEKELQARKTKSDYKDTFIIVPDLLVFTEAFGQGEAKFKALYNEGPKLGIHFIIAGTKQNFFKVDNITRHLKNEITTALVAMRMYDQSLVDHVENSREQKLADDQLYLYNKGSYKKIKIIKQNIGE